MSTVTIKNASGTTLPAYDVKIEYPSLNASHAPMFSFKIRDPTGIKAQQLTAGVELTSYRNNIEQYVGLIDTVTPTRTKDGLVMKVSCIHKGYAIGRRLHLTNYDVLGNGVIVGDYGDADTDGATINPHGYTVFRAPSGYVDFYGLTEPLDGVTYDEVIENILLTKNTAQVYLDSGNYLLPVEEDSNILIGQGNSFASPGVQLGPDTSGGFREGGSTRGFVESIPLVKNDPFAHDPAVITEATAVIFGEAVGLDYSNSQGSGGSFTRGSHKLIADVESKWGWGLQNTNPTARSGAGAKLQLKNTDTGFNDDSSELSFTIRFFTGNFKTHNTEIINSSAPHFGPWEPSVEGRPYHVWLERIDDDTARLRYEHTYDAGGDTWGLEQYTSGSLVITPGWHTLSARISRSSRTVELYVDRAEFINDSWTASEDPVAGSDSRLVLGGSLSGGITEFRFWKSLVAQATLDDINDPDDATYDDTAEGNEYGFYKFEAAESVKNPVLEVCRNARVDDFNDRNYVTATLSKTLDVEGTKYIKWETTTPVDLSSEAGEQDALGFRLTIPGSEGDTNSIVLYYVRLTATTTPNNGLTKGTVFSYEHPNKASFGPGLDYYAGDLNGQNALEAIERVRQLTQNDLDTNQGVHCDFIINNDLSWDFLQSRGSQKEREYRFDTGDLKVLDHEYYAGNLAYQTVAYGAGDGSAQTRFVSKEEYATGGLYDSNRDPGNLFPYSLDFTPFTNVGSKFRLQVNSSNRVAQAFTVPYEITLSTGAVTFSMLRQFNDASVGTVTVRISDTENSGGVTDTFDATTIPVGSTVFHSFDFASTVLQPDTVYYVTVTHSGSDRVWFLGGINSNYTEQDLFFNGVASSAWDAGDLVITGTSTLTSIYGEQPRLMEFVDQQETEPTALLAKATAFHKHYRDPLETVTLELSSEFIPYFTIGDQIKIKDLKTRTDGYFRITELERRWPERGREEIRVRLGEASKTIADEVADSKQAKTAITSREPSMHGSVSARKLDNSFSLPQMDSLIIDTANGLTFSQLGGNGGLLGLTVNVSALAPHDAQYLTLSADATLLNERVFTLGDGLTGTDGGAGGAFTIDYDVDSLTDILTSFTIDPASDYLLIWDDSELDHKKVLVDDLVGSISLTVKESDGTPTETGVDTLNLLSSDFLVASGGAGIADVSIVDSGINHDSTTGFVADEHIAHSGVSITAGAGLTGGGDITTTRTLDIGAGDGITVNADDIALASTVAGDGLGFTTGVLNVNVDGTTIETSTDTLRIKDAGVTFTKIQDIGTDKLLGRDTAASGDVEEISVSGGIEFTGAGGIQTSAFTGDVTKAAGGTALTIPADSITGAQLAPAVAGDGLSQDGSGNLDLDINDLANTETLTAATDLLAIYDQTDSRTEKIAMSDFVTGLFGLGVADDSEAITHRDRTLTTWFTAGMQTGGTDTAAKVGGGTVVPRRAALGNNDVVFFAFIVPDDLDATEDVEVVIHFSHPSQTGTGPSFAVRADDVAPNSQITTAAMPSIGTPSGGTSGSADEHETATITWSSSGVTAGYLLMFSVAVSSPARNVGDTADVDTEVWALDLNYQAKIS